MSTSGEGPTNPEVSEGGAGEPGRRPAVLSTVLALAFCGGALYFSWRVLWDNNHPVATAARGLQARTPSGRIAAVDELNGLRFGHSGEVLHCLIPALGDPDAGVRAAAARTVGLVADHALTIESEVDAVADVWAALLGLLKDPEAEVRGTAAAAVGIIVGTAPGGSRRGEGRSAKKAGPALDLEAAVGGLTGLLDDRDPAVRLAAISAMGPLAGRVPGSPPKPLLAAMEDESESNRVAAVSALASYQSGLDPWVPTLLRHLEKDELAVRGACVVALGRLRPPAVSAAIAPAVIAAMGSRDRDVRLQLVTLLGRLNPDVRLAAPALIAMMNEPIESDRRVVDRSVFVAYSGPAHAAIQALGRIAPRTGSAGEAIAALGEVLRTGHPQRKASAAQALGGFGPAAAPAVPALIAFLKEDAASKVISRDGEAAAQALARIAPSTPAAGDAVTALTAALTSGQRVTRGAAVKALVAFGPKAAPAIPAIRQLQEKDPATDVREAAAEALAKLEAGPN